MRDCMAMQARAPPARENIMQAAADGACARSPFLRRVLLPTRSLVFPARWCAGEEAEGGEHDQLSPAEIIED